MNILNDPIVVAVILFFGAIFSIVVFNRKLFFGKTAY